MLITGASVKPREGMFKAHLRTRWSDNTPLSISDRLRRSLCYSSRHGYNDSGGSDYHSPEKAMRGHNDPLSQLIRIPSSKYPHTSYFAIYTQGSGD